MSEKKNRSMAAVKQVFFSTEEFSNWRRKTRLFENSLSAPPNLAEISDYIGGVLKQNCSVKNFYFKYFPYSFLCRLRTMTTKLYKNRLSMIGKGGGGDFQYLTWEV